MADADTTIKPVDKRVYKLILREASVKPTRSTIPALKGVPL